LAKVPHSQNLGLYDVSQDFEKSLLLTKDRKCSLADELMENIQGEQSMMNMTVTGRSPSSFP